MRSIEVCLSPELIHLHDLSEKIVVVIDVLRATSCITTAIAHGVESITPFSNLEDCRAMKAKGYFIAGERNGATVEGFDFGNSPFSYMKEELVGEKIAITTTNGTTAINKSLGASDVIIGSFLNIQSVVNYLKNQEHNALLFCSGWKGRVSLEDTLCAGSIVSSLKDSFQTDGDTTIAAEALIAAANNHLVSFLQGSSHVERLKKLDIQKDVDFCLTPNQYDVVPILKAGELVDLGAA